jgi:UDP-GlcNAc:undecaprenyl-phosphate GlcNAc-1-phosphate transferase
MNNFAIITLLFIFFNTIIILNFKHISKKINIYDEPNLRKIHKKKTPVIGGVIILLNFFLYSIFFFFFNEIEIEILNFFTKKINYYLFLFTILIIFFFGIYDDKRNLNPNIKLLILSLITFILIGLDNQILLNELKFSFIQDILSLNKYSYLFTILCFLLFINACNMFDGINGQSASFFIIFIILLIQLTHFNYLLTILFISLISFLYLNYSGKIFLGNNGICVLAFIFSYTTIRLYNNKSIEYADTIFIAMMIPGFDMLRLFIQRLYNKKNPFHSDKKHLHHLILNNLSFQKTILLLITYLITPFAMLKIGFSNLTIIFFNILIYILLIAIFYKKKFK